MIQTETLVVGASFAGLSAAACLQTLKLGYILIEKELQVAAPWHHHYERLHLHTNKRVSHLPFKKFDQSIPRYPSRQQVEDYAAAYQQAFHIHPIFDTLATSIRKENGYWLTETNREVFQSKFLIMATGPLSKPKPVDFAGMETFTGRIIHSQEYKTGRDFNQQQVLVVGFGNSACEFAIDLYEQGAYPVMSVRSAVNVIPRDILGIPILELSLLISRLPPRLADALTAPLIRMHIGDLAKLGLRKKPYGPFREIRQDRNIPVLDIGIIRHIRQGHISIQGNIDHIEGKTVYFSGGKQSDFDAIIACIGYCSDQVKILQADRDRLDDLQFPLRKQRHFGKDGLYFCGFWIGPTGQIREIAGDAKKIAKDIAKKRLADQ